MALAAKVGRSRPAPILNVGDAISSFMTGPDMYFASDVVGLGWPMVTYAVTANIPQVVLTLTYYWYNQILTNMLANAEYSSYGVKRKSLRVTWPAKDSRQRSTYYLSLPYRYSIPLLSFFYVLVMPFADQHPIENEKVSELGFLGLPIFLSLIVGSIMLLALIGLSFRKYPSSIPVVGSCSAAISAACHPPKDEDLDHAALGLLMWGETQTMPAWEPESHGETMEDRGHCRFTSLDTVPPTLEKLYA
ncbi:uncharacterized protein BO80DRAFT_493976 [Aspergillus ibericus CBS 121593]|uniref:Uncharacterized protein n=1 Tax=Aspergillus ibericus CBS 121593 TaxID=1448316 RepID=A0A395H082_9EURO|nr:hypothetical protein BO80DRAFT_493976 [Aspergillus ibericus CBS 121593]RAL00739.1 hypothetical protein BO80DRAFT_493976 [Aspergillus ibericus CBS 121593]